MLESIFLWLAVIGVVIVIMTCVNDYSDKTNENILKALIIATGVFIFLASVMGRINL